MLEIDLSKSKQPQDVGLREAVPFAPGLDVVDGGWRGDREAEPARSGFEFEDVLWKQLAQEVIRLQQQQQRRRHERLQLLQLLQTLDRKPG